MLQNNFNGTVSNYETVPLDFRGSNKVIIPTDGHSKFRHPFQRTSSLLHVMHIRKKNGEI